MLQKKNEGILFSTEIRVVGSYTDRLLNILKKNCEPDPTRLHSSFRTTWWKEKTNYIELNLIVLTEVIYRD